MIYQKLFFQSSNFTFIVLHFIKNNNNTVVKGTTYSCTSDQTIRPHSDEEKNSVYLVSL